ncbi:Reverse transcriptase (RNA-dependent DNA polymerase) [Nesidiocoris tenuis]|uniref:Reverse transcriptase (RNA-dependent DNA polymerase) n=1 Tax=Nesidiocoris tenuis TaxID=355587 RepID=A0ABN7B9M5_9HEMI|nr:Reverse transcriptase (RNA-dependent DNA polymerase) [Nesidiocoris tenuis]
MLAEASALGHVVKELLTDNGGEYICESVRKILQEKGIRHRTTMPYTPEQSGCSERDNRTVVEVARTLMHSHEEFPQALWAEMINTAAYILNRSGVSSIPNKSPHELWIGNKPNIKNLRIIGSVCYAHIPKQQRKKMSKKAVKGILIGYENNEGYRIWCKETNKLIRSRDVVFNEAPLPSDSNVPLRSLFDTVESDEDRQVLQPEENSEAEEISEPVENPVTTTDAPQICDEEIPGNLQEISEESESVDCQDDFHEFSPMKLRDRSTLRKPQRFEDYIMTLVNEIAEVKTPDTYKEAMKSENREKWIEAMNSEMNSLTQMKTWSLENLPAGKKAISCKWVFKVKTNPDGTIDRFKARLVAKGFLRKRL